MQKKKEHQLPQTTTPSDTDVITPEMLKSNADLMRDYTQWCNHPITKIVKAIMINLMVPQHPPISDMAEPHVMASLHAQQVGAWWYHTKMFTLDKEVVEEAPLESTFGAEDIMKDQGYEGTEL